jgi:hypothetical protein
MRSVDHPALRLRDRANNETGLMGGQAMAKGASITPFASCAVNGLGRKIAPNFPRPVEMTRLAQSPFRAKKDLYP